MVIQQGESESICQSEGVRPSTEPNRWKNQPTICSAYYSWRNKTTIKEKSQNDKPVQKVHRPHCKCTEHCNYIAAKCCVTTLAAETDVLRAPRLLLRPRAPPPRHAPCSLRRAATDCPQSKNLLLLQAHIGPRDGNARRRTGYIE